MFLSTTNLGIPSLHSEMGSIINYGRSARPMRARPGGPNGCKRAPGVRHFPPMSAPADYKNKFLPKPPKRLAVIDQDSCTGCAGAPTCVTFCETVTAGKGKQVDAIRLVDSPEKP